MRRLFSSWRLDVASNVSTAGFVSWSRTLSKSMAFVCLVLALAHGQDTSRFYLGFDRNDYPGDANLKTLRQTFSYTGYWLNNPPGASSNSWAGHRAVVESAGFGFLVLFNGRLYAQLKTVANATRLGRADARAAPSRPRPCIRAHGGGGSSGTRACIPPGATGKVMIAQQQSPERERAGLSRAINLAQRF